MQENLENTNKNKKIAALLIASMATLFIISSFYLEQIFEFLRVSIPVSKLPILKYGFLGVGILDLITLPILLKLADKADKQ